MKAGEELITETVQRRCYILLADGQQTAMLAEDEGPRAWKIEKAEWLERSEDDDTACELLVALNEAGAQRLRTANERFKESRLAILLDGRVVALHKLDGPIPAEWSIRGWNDPEQGRRVAKMLSASGDFP